MIISILLFLCLGLTTPIADATAPVADGPSHVTGSLTGVDGQPIAVSHAHLSRPLDAPITSAPVGRDGQFTLTTTERGLVVLKLTGLGYDPLEVPVWLAGGDTVELRASLTREQPAATFDKIKVTGEFNQFSRKSGHTMEKQPDGTYAIELPAEQPFRYQLLGVLDRGRVFAGQTADRYDWGYELGATGYYQDGYRAVVTPKQGKVRIVFDPSKVERPQPSDPKVATATFADPSSISAGLMTYQQEARSRRTAYNEAAQAYYKSGKPWNEFTYDWSQEIAAAQASLARESRPPVREAKRMELWSLCAEFQEKRSASTGARTPDACATTASTALLEQIPPESTLWSWMNMQVYVQDSLAKQASENADVKTYVARMLDRQPSKRLLAQLLLDLLREADTAGRMAEVTTYFTRLKKEYPTSDAARRANAFSPERRVRPGKPLPAFTVPSLENAAAALTNANVAGKVLLIDVWATWCPGCVQGMPTLHKLYEKYHAAGLEILSASADDSVAEVREYRARPETPMPWLHGYIGPVRGGPLMQNLEVDGYPTYIIVDRSGTIVLKGHEHEPLEDAIAKALGSGEPSTSAAAAPAASAPPR